MLPVAVVGPVLGGTSEMSPLRAAVPDLGYRKQLSSAKAQQVLGWTARDPREAVLAAGSSMIASGLAGG